jgi:sensor histidine kinase regulating citrate/malate metabolism
MQSLIVVEPFKILGNDHESLNETEYVACRKTFFNIRIERRLICDWTILSQFAAPRCHKITMTGAVVILQKEVELKHLNEDLTKIKKWARSNVLFNKVKFL